MIIVHQDNTNDFACQYFSVQHFVTWVCGEGHQGGFAGSPPVVYLMPHPREITRVGDAAHTDDIDIGCYLTHLHARYAISGAGAYNESIKLFTFEDTICQHAGCSKMARVLAVQTHWPDILHIVPETRALTAEAFNARLQPDYMPRPVQFPLRFSIQTKSMSRDSYIPAPGEFTVSDTVDYEMVG